MAAKAAFLLWNLFGILNITLKILRIGKKERNLKIMEKMIKKINWELIGAAKDVLYKIADDLMYDEKLEDKVAEWYVSARNTESYSLRLAVLACVAVSGVDVGVYDYCLPATDAVLAILPDIARRMEHKLPICIPYTYYAAGYIDRIENVRMF